MRDQKKSPSRHPAKRSSHARNSLEKVGDSKSAARKIGGKGDFGAPASDPIERSYASSATRHQDKGGISPRSGADGARTTGVGGKASGPGSSSGGDIDTDIIGIATPEPEARPFRAADATKSPRKHKSIPRPAKLRGSTVNRSGGDVSTTNSGQGTSAITNPLARNDDSFPSEISNDEAAGADNSLSDNE